MCSSDDQVKYLLGPAIVEGTDIVDATASVQETTGAWVVLLGFNAEAQASWADYTAAHIGEAVALTLHGQVISAPVINGVVSGSTTISGDFSEESAQHLAEQLGG